MNVLRFGEIISADFGAYVFPVNNYNAPSRNLESVSVLGKNGNILFDNQRYDNVDISYTWIIMKDFQTQYKRLRQLLLSIVGYQQLFYNDDLEYREGYLSQVLEPIIAADGKSGKFVTTFSCKPQIYLREGDDELEFDDNCSIVNPTEFASKPLFRIYGTGVLTVNNTGIIVSNHGKEYLDFDVEIMDAYYQDENMNKYVTIIGQVPSFVAGTNDINKGTGISRFIVTPRWFYI